MAYIIAPEHCTNCGRCAMACPTHSITGTPDGAPTIRRDTCTECGACVRVCPLDAMYKESEPWPAPVPHAPITLDCDLCVIGGGGGGLVAAGRFAWLTGKKVIVLEKMRKCGGSAWFASTMRMYGSQWQKDRGVEDNLNDQLVNIMDQTYWELDSHLVRNALVGTGKWFDWLGELDPQRDSKFVESFYVFDGPDSMITPGYCEPGGRIGSPESNGTGWYATQLMQKVILEKGGEIRTQHRAKKLVMENGRVTAVIAQDPGGEVRVNCKACVMSPGSWINNQEILDRCVPEFGRLPRGISSHCHIACTGDGIGLAESADAFIDYDSFCMRLMGGAGMAPGETALAMTTGPYAVYVNQNGQRWINELTMGRSSFFAVATALVYQPEGKNWCIFDEDMAKAASRQPFRSIKKKFNPIPEVPVPENCAEDLRVNAKRAPQQLISADTVEELAEKLGVPAENLKETIARYNRMCRQGRDDDFFKEAQDMLPFGNGPYYAVGGGVGTDGAFGGVRVNENIQAYAGDRETLIENLYVPGDFASGRFLNMHGYKVQILNDLSWAMSSGYIAGTHAALIAQGKTGKEDLYASL